MKELSRVFVNANGHLQHKLFHKDYVIIGLRNFYNPNDKYFAADSKYRVIKLSKVKK